MPLSMAPPFARLVAFLALPRLVRQPAPHRHERIGGARSGVYGGMERTMTPRSQNRRTPIGHFALAALGALSMTAWVGALPAAGQSFDCRNARYTDEKTICRESRLGELD